MGDAIFDSRIGIKEPCTIVDPIDHTRRKVMDESLVYEDTLKTIFREGELCYDLPKLERVRERVQTELSNLHPGIRRFENPHSYPVGLEKSLHALKTQLVLQARGFSNSTSE